ncbi:MAG: GIY-YIG nuclease family protein [Crocinitomicaceae bacterium]|nr:GIY-YIG nuclease family protein [Crocinitomicaceae bacterium]
MQHNYFIYILSNPGRTTLYVGVTNNIPKRIIEHKSNPEGFANKYSCYDLVYFEHYSDVNRAIEREKQIKKWSRSKKDNLVTTFNPKWLDLLTTFY